MSESPTGRPDPRRARVRRHRRERQIIVFGVLIILVAFAGVVAAGIYRGDVEGPFSQPFVTPVGAFESDVTLVCPPANSTPMQHRKMAVRVLNGTDVGGLAGQVADQLEGRNFVIVSVGNWSRSYDETVRIYFGPEGVRQAYTLARHFEVHELVLDNREGTLVDLVLGDAYAETPALVDALSSDLDRDLILSANAECLPVDLITPVPAPRELPDSPFDKTDDQAAEGEAA